MSTISLVCLAACLMFDPRAGLAHDFFPVGNFKLLRPSFSRRGIIHALQKAAHRQSHALNDERLGTIKVFCISWRKRMVLHAKSCADSTGSRTDGLQSFCLDTPQCAGVGLIGLLIESFQTSARRPFPTSAPACLRVLLLIGIFVTFPVASLRGQSTNSSLSGTLRDPRGAVVTNAHLSLTASATGAVRHVDTSSEGTYRFSNLQAGAYTLKVSAVGFAPFSQAGIILALNEAATVDVTLSIGTATENVEVNASPINHEDATLKGEISPEVLKDLPLNVSGSSRSAASFVVILPGVNTGAGNNPFETRINGGMKMGDEAALDGSSMQEGLMSQSGVVALHSDYPISPEAISEVSVLTSSYEPQYGTTTSGVITMVTKSGTNEFHGDLREYLHNTALNATQFGSPYKPKDIENQFGGSVGGPVKIPRIWSTRNKAFFFLNIERWTIRGGTVFPVDSIPSVRERQGDFTDWVGFARKSDTNLRSGDHDGESCL